MGDRSGGREPKGASLKKSKKNPGSTVAKAKTKVKDVEQIIKSSQTLPPPSLTYLGKYFDCSCALLSRQFDRDRDRVLQRSKDEGVSGILLWFSDVEKQSSLLDICKNTSGYCYAAIGISPDNIDRTNKKMHSGWLLKIEELALSAECVAIISGLNLAREMGTHFAQESLLQSCTEIATRLHLPLLLHVASDGGSLERTLEILLELNLIQELNNNNNNDNNDNNDNVDNEFKLKIILYDALSTCSGDINKINNLLKYGIYFMISAAGLTDANDEIRSNYNSCLQQIPIQQILPCTDSPWKTPQNLSDTYLRTLRNEPANISAVIDAIILGLPQEKVLIGREEINQVLFNNCLKVFHIPQLEVENSTNINLKDNLHNNNNINNNNSNEKLTSEELFEKTSESNINNNNKNDNNNNNNNNNNITTKNSKSKNTKDKNTNTEGIDSNETNNNNNSSLNIVRYNCVKCRRLIATSSDIITHSVGASRSTIFKIGQEGLCSASIFIPYNSSNNNNGSNNNSNLEKGKQKGKKGQQIQQLNQFENDCYKIENENIHCIGCHAKLGKLSLGEATCACGAIVNGPVLRINTAKLDQFFEDTTSLDVNQLTMMLSRLENERIEDNDGINDNNKSKSKKKKKAKQRSENRGNFSSYRNKSFVPNASRAGQGTSSSSITNLKGGNNNDSEDDDDNDNDNENESNDDNQSENENNKIDNDEESEDEDESEDNDDDN